MLVIGGGRAGAPAAGLLTLLLLVAACGGSASTAPAPVVLRVIGSSELADMTPVLDAAAAATGVRVELTRTPTLAGVRDLAAGLDNDRADAVWFTSNRYVDLDPAARSLLGEATPTMSSPVLLGLRRSVVQRLGWDRRPVTWTDIAEAAARREYTYAMADPQQANSGLSALVSVASAAAGSGRALDSTAVARVAPSLAGFAGARALSAESSDELARAFVARCSGRLPPGPVDGIITYESSIVGLGDAGVPTDPIVPVYPQDGVVSGDYPLTALASIRPDARDGYTRLAAWLRSPQGQHLISTTTHRREAVPSAAPNPNERPLVELPFPGSRATVDALVAAYANPGPPAPPLPPALPPPTTSDRPPGTTPASPCPPPSHATR